MSALIQTFHKKVFFLFFGFIQRTISLSVENIFSLATLSAIIYDIRIHCITKVNTWPSVTGSQLMLLSLKELWLTRRVTRLSRSFTLSCCQAKTSRLFPPNPAKFWYGWCVLALRFGCPHLYCANINIKNYKELEHWIMQFKTFYWLSHYGISANIP